MVFNRKRTKSKVHVHYIHDPRGVAKVMIESALDWISFAGFQSVRNRTRFLNLG